MTKYGFDRRTSYQAALPPDVKHRYLQRERERARARARFWSERDLCMCVSCISLCTLYCTLYTCMFVYCVFIHPLYGSANVVVCV